MKQYSLRLPWMLLVGLLIVHLEVQEADAAGSPNTRLIGLGINYAIGAPLTPGQFFEIDKQTGGITPIGSAFIIETDHLGANLAGNSADQLFNVLGGWPVARLNELTLSGDVDQFVPLSDGSNFPPHAFQIAFDSQDRLHGILVNGNPAVDAPPVLAQINTSTGVASTIAIWNGGANTMAFDLQDRLYSVAGSLGLMRINPVTGDATIIGGDVMNFPPDAIVFDRDGTLFAATDRLQVVDPSSGNAATVGAATFGPYSMVGLAVVVVPEPDALTLFGFAVMGWRVFSRRWRTAYRFGHQNSRGDK